jgi:RNA polymerase sigma-70 factor, ECF subfamily
MERQLVTAAPITDLQGDVFLVTAAQRGDRAAFGRLYDRYARMVHGILLSRVPPREVDDLVQEVFLSALRQIHALRDVARFGAWLASITRNRANDYFRRSFLDDKILEPISEDQFESQWEGPSGSQRPDEEATIILATIRTLPEAYREPLILRLVEGMTGPEIATRTGLTRGSVRVNLCRGMQLLREKLRDSAKRS